VVRSCAAFEQLDDDHPATAAWAEICRLRLGGIGAVCFDGINGNDWRHEQFACARDVLGALAAGEQAIVADAVEACGQHVDEKAADELVAGWRSSWRGDPSRSWRSRSPTRWRALPGRCWRTVNLPKSSACGSLRMGLPMEQCGRVLRVFTNCKG
jgi:hypothetical protein